MLSQVTICKLYVNKLGILQFFAEKGNRQVFKYSYWLVLPNHCPITVFVEQAVTKSVIAFLLANLS